MGADVEYFGEGGSRPPYFLGFLQGGGLRNPVFSVELWEIHPWIGRTLGSFNHRMARGMKNIQPNRYVEVRWIYPLLDAEIKAVALE